MKNHSLFSFGSTLNPLYLLDLWLNPYNLSKQIMLRNKPLDIEWTKRAQTQLQIQSQPLIIEMQLYFSCVVKKRVLFSEQAEFATTTVDDNFQVAFHPVESASCDPIEFAKNFPAKREFDSISAKKMHPRLLKIDYKQNNWQGEFFI